MASEPDETDEHSVHRNRSLRMRPVATKDNETRMGMHHPGTAAIAEQGWLKAHQWLLLRRASQLGILALFLAGPLAGIWILTGSLSASMVLGVLPLTDPLLLAQSMLSGAWPVISGVLGALIVIVFYALIGGRVFCAWVCPVNLVTDLAAWLGRRLDIHVGARISRDLRYWVLGLILLFPLTTGVIAWESINPVSIAQRGLIFGGLWGLGWGWALLGGVFLHDLFIVRRGWCGHLCPMGAFYALIGARAVVRVSASGRERCDDCMDCFAICPEPQVIKPALKGAARGLGPVIDDFQCTNCGRCIDVCSKEVFRFALGQRNQAVSPHALGLGETTTDPEMRTPSHALSSPNPSNAVSHGRNRASMSALDSVQQRKRRQ